MTNAPAVLLEAGVIVNRAEELNVATADFRKRVSESVVVAALKFCGAALKAPCAGFKAR